MPSKKNSTTVKSSDGDLVIVRYLDAPRDLVFKSWSEPERVIHWWGPRNFTVPFCKIDFRTGGIFHYCMRSSDGKDYWGKGVYREIVKPERIVVTDTFSDVKGNIVSPTVYGMSPDWPQESLINVTFEENEGKTKLTLHHGVSKSLAKESGAETGWSETLDRLTEYLESV